MERFPCEPDNTACKYFFQGCHESRHHIFKRSDADTPLKHRFAELDSNKLHLCRYLHDLLELSVGWPEYPDIPLMQAVIAREDG